MTRQEFIDGVNDIWALREFCAEIDYYLENIYDKDERDENIDNNLIDDAREFTWQEMLDYLNSIPTGYDFYYRDDWGEWTGYSADDIRDFKDEVLEYADDNGMFDDADTDEEDPDEWDEEELDGAEEPEEDDEPVELGCDMRVFLQSGNETLQAIQARDEAEKARIEQAMQKFLRAKEA